MYQLITKDSNFKKKYLYFARYDKYDESRNMWYFTPNINRFFVRTQHYSDIMGEEYLTLLGENMNTAIPLNKIPSTGTFSVQIGEDTIISTSKQEVARFLRKKIMHNVGNTPNLRYNTMWFPIEEAQKKYKKCLETLKNLK